MIKHCLSIDVEGFCEGNCESFDIQEYFGRNTRERYEIESNINEILLFLEDHGIKCTFFILGIIAKEQPNIIKSIAEAGHEIGSHSYEHKRLFNMDYNMIKNTIERSKLLLEDVSGRKVYGFRAPEFSINEENIFVFDILCDLGFYYDSSVLPTNIHDVYGMAGVDRFIHSITDSLIEFPCATINIFGRKLPALGGGYFRLYPLFITKMITMTYEKRRQPAMFYLHPFEIGSNYPKIDKISYTRKIRHYINIEKGKTRLTKLFKQFSFDSAINILNNNGFLEN